MIFSISCSKDRGGSSARPSAAASEGDPIKIGVTMPVTGAFANMGIPELEGIMTAAAVINKTGGINGRQLEMIHVDVPDVAAAKGETDRLINQRKVTCVVGTYGSTLSVAVAETCNRYNTVYCELSSFGTAISRSGFKTTIRQSANADQVGQELIDVLVKEIAPGKLGKDVKDLKIAFASEDGVWGMNNVDACLKLLEDSGLSGNVVLKESYAADTKDLSTLVLKMKRAAPDILFLFAYEQDGIIFVKQSKELGFDCPIIAGGGGGLAMPGFGEALGSLATGIISSDFAPLPPYSNKDALMGLDEYTETYKELYGKEAYGIYGHTLYGNFMAFVEVLKNAASLSTKDIMASAYATDIPSFQLASGYGAKYEDVGADLCMNIRAWPYLVQWQRDGHLYTIWPSEVAGTEPLLPKPAF
jgi:branched-chain amino acid transport system substrate-binding protein